MMLAPNNEEIYCILYYDGHPSFVLSRQEFAPGRFSESAFDFAWSKKWGSIYHDSGGGGPFIGSVHLWDEGEQLALAVWIAPGIELFDDGEYGPPEKEDDPPFVQAPPRRMTPDEIRARGWTVLTEPLDGNPFDDAIGDYKSVECPTCDDCMPEEDADLCEHIAWCGECSEYVHLPDGGRCDYDGKCSHMVRSTCGHHGPFADDHDLGCVTTPVVWPTP